MPTPAPVTPETFAQQLQDDAAKAKAFLATLGGYLKAGLVDLEDVAPLIETLLPYIIKNKASQAAMVTGEDVFAAVTKALSAAGL